MKKDKGFEDYREYQASKIDGPIRDEPEGAGHLREDTTPIHGSVLDPYAPRADITAERIIRAAMRMDWAQSMNGPPCFHVEDDGRFCGRASAWAGHQTLSVHLYEPLYVAITRAVKDANKSEGSATREGAVLSPSAEASRLAGSSTPSDPPAKWTEEQRRSATAVAATVAFWKERADDREIAQTCDEIAKHAYLFVQDPKEGERSAMREVRPETSASSEPLGSALSDDEIGSQIMNGLGGEKYDPSDLMPWERRVGKRARALFAKPAPVAVTRERIMTIIRRARHLAMETSPGDVNYSEERVADAVLSALSAPVSAEDFKKACEAYRDARDDVATSLRAALASIGIATEGT